MQGAEPVVVSRRCNRDPLFLRRLVPHPRVRAQQCKDACGLPTPRSMRLEWVREARHGRRDGAHSSCVGCETLVGTSPAATASISGVAPPIACAVADAPACSRAAATSTRPHAHAQCSAVHLCASAAPTSARAPRRQRNAAGETPLARCSGRVPSWVAALALAPAARSWATMVCCPISHAACIGCESHAQPHRRVRRGQREVKAGQGEVKASSRAHCRSRRGPDQPTPGQHDEPGHTARDARVLGSRSSPGRPHGPSAMPTRLHRGAR